MHVTIGLFEIHETTWLSMVKQLRILLKKYGLMHHVIIFLKY
jgi:hypothetical protein